MKRLTIIAVAAAAALGIALNGPLFAHEGHSHAASSIIIPETTEAVLDEIKKQHATLTAAVTGKKLKAVHDLAESMTVLVKALPDKVPADKKTSVQSSTDNMAKLLDTLHHAADDGDQPRSGIELKKLDGAVTNLEKQLK